MIDERTNSLNSIIEINGRIEGFWSKAQGWAPESAAELLSKSRLDWQVSLSHTLAIWVRPIGECLTDGELILAWTNLGALVEGTLKLFLSVFEQDFMKNVTEMKYPKAYDNKKNVARQPDELMLGTLREFCVKKQIFGKEILDFVYLVQMRRNTIHAFKDREIGNADEFWQAVNDYKNFLQLVQRRLPYPH